MPVPLPVLILSLFSELYLIFYSTNALVFGFSGLFVDSFAFILF
jgi:hypothetical protein